MVPLSALLTVLLTALPAPKELSPESSIGPYLLLDTATGGVNVRWFTPPGTAGTLEFGPTEALGKSLTPRSEAPGPSHALIPWTATLPGKPGETLWYRVRLGNGWSPVYPVSLPNLKAPDLRFLILGDMQDAGVLTPPRRWEEVARSAAQKAQEIRASFLLLPGDLTEDNFPGYWKSFFDKGQDLLARYPSVAVPGNHDSPTGRARGQDYKDFLSYFPGSLNKGFTAGPGAFLLLNTEVTAFGNLEEHQETVDFATNFLSSVQDKPWVLALMHYTPWHALVRHQDSNEKTRGMTPSFDHKVDWVFTGHVHAYQRTIPLIHPGTEAPGGYGRGPGKGPGYVVIPPAGNWPEPYSRLDAGTLEGSVLAYPKRIDEIKFPKILSELGFITVEMSAQKMAFEVWGMGDLSLNREVPLHLIERVETLK